MPDDDEVLEVRITVELLRRPRTAGRLRRVTFRTLGPYPVPLPAAAVGAAAALAAAEMAAIHQPRGGNPCLEL